MGATIAELEVAGRGGLRWVAARNGAVEGRYANRIANARFELNGRRFTLDANDGAHTLHGGARGFAAQEWAYERASETSVLMSLTSPDGDQGFPGTLRVTVEYAIEEGDALRIRYAALSDADTVINLTNHAYFDLGGTPAEHVLQIAADSYTPVDGELIPTGKISPVTGTRFDFRKPRVIGSDPFDTNFVLRSPGVLAPAAILSSPRTGRTLEAYTDEPGLQLFTGKSAGVALETQHFPDSPNRPQFPSTVLRAGSTFRSTTLYRFGGCNEVI